MSQTTDRFLNVGLELKLKKQGDVYLDTVYVKELNLRSVQVLSKDLLKIVYSLQEFSRTNAESSAAEVAAHLVSLPELLEGLERVLAQSINHPFEYVDSLGLTDQVKLIEAFFAVNKLSEIKELFSRMLKQLNLPTDPAEQSEKK
ncbi:MAG: hypothetical protein ACRC78_17020 [Planktothrix sp.]